MTGIFNDAANERRLLARNGALQRVIANRNATIARLRALKTPNVVRSASNRKPWIEPIMRRIVSTRQIALALTPGTSIASTDNKLLSHGYGNLADIKMACAAAVRGDPTKIVRCSTNVAGAGLSLSLPLNTVVNGSAGVNASPDSLAPTSVFGWLVRVSASVNNFAFRGVEISVGKPSIAAGVITIPSPVISYVISGKGSPCVDVVILSPSNAAGVASIVPGVAGGILGNDNTQITNNVISIASLGQADLYAQIESLNATDFLLGSQSATVNKDEVADMFDGDNDDGDEADWLTSAYGGMRDQV